MPKAVKSVPPSMVGEMSFDKLLAASASAPSQSSRGSKRVRDARDAPAPEKKTSHRAELDALRERDPKFYKYLQSNSADLLDFEGGDESDGDDDDAAGGDGGDDDEAAAADESDGDASDGDGGEDANDDIEDDDGGGVDDAAAGAKDVGALDGRNDILHMKEARALFASAFERKTFRGLVQCVQALRSAVFAASSVDFEGSNTASAASRKKMKKQHGEARNREGKGIILAEAAAAAPRALRYRIPNPSVYMAVVTSVLSRAPGALSAHLGDIKNASGGSAAAAPAPAPRVPLSDYSGWARLRPVARSLLACLVELLSTTQDPKLLVFTLRAARGLVPYVAAFAPVQRRILRAIVALWSSPPGDNGGVRLVAYLRLRQIATVLPYPSIDGVLRAAYLGYVRSAKRMSEESAPGVSLMISCLVELFGIDGASSYNHAFTYLRAVAVGLRTALVSGSDSSSGAVAAARAAVASVASWATVNALRALTAIVCAHGATPSAPLWELVYPLAQVLSGLPRAAPAPSHYPLRLHMAALQNELQWATGVYVPVALPLLDILRCRALTLKPRGAAPSKPTPLSLIVRVAPSAADTKSYQDSLVARVLELILDATRSFFASPALPELVAPIVVQLRIFAADTRVPPWKSRARALIDTLVGASTAVSTRRATLPFTPTDTAALANFMSKEASALRLARSQAQSAAIAAEINAARLEALNPKPASTTAREGARNGGSDDDDDDDDEEGDDDNGNDASDDDDSASDNQEASGDDEDEDGSDEEDEDAGEETEASRPRAPPTFKSLKAKGSDSRGRFKILPRAASTLGEDVVGDIDAF